MGRLSLRCSLALCVLTLRILAPPYNFLCGSLSFHTLRDVCTHQSTVFCATRLKELSSRDAHSARTRHCGEQERMLQEPVARRAGAEGYGEPSRSKECGSKGSRGLPRGGTPAVGWRSSAFRRWRGSQDAPTGSLGEATAGGRKAVEAKGELRMGSTPHGDGDVGRSKEAACGQLGCRRKWGGRGGRKT